MNRTQNAIRNAGFGILSKIFSLIFAFATRTIFIYQLGSTYLGVNGLFTEMLSLLSFAELGFGSAMTFSLYKPVADKDDDKVIKLLNFYKTVYKVVAIVIAVLGLSLLPFLNYIVKGADWLTASELRTYFLIFLGNNVIGYFVTYRYTYLNALQKNYIAMNVDTVVTIISYIAQIAVILFFKSFLGYLLINSTVLIISRVFIILYLNKKYPILKKKPTNPLTREEKNLIFYEVKGLAVHQIASAAVHSTDNIIISTFISVVTVGYISNYMMIINSVLGFVTILFNSVTSGFGNLVAISSTQNFRKVFKEINFANFWVYGFCCVAFWVLVPPFITLWIGADKLIDRASFTLIILNCYLQGQCTIYNNARNAKGNFNKDKWWALTQAIVNLIVSIIAVYYCGLLGVYIGTITSRMIYIIFRPYSTYELLFDESVKKYYVKLIKYFFIFSLAAIITDFFVSMIITSVTVDRFLISVIIVCILPNFIFLLFTFKSEEIQMWKNRIYYYSKR